MNQFVPLVILAMLIGLLILIISYLTKSKRSLPQAFTVAFEEISSQFEEEHFIMTLMNQEGPYEVYLDGKGKHHIQINTKVAVPNRTVPMMGGEMFFVPIIISEGQENRKL